MGLIYCNICGGVLSGVSALAGAHPCTCNRDEWQARRWVPICFHCGRPLLMCAGDTKRVSLPNKVKEEEAQLEETQTASATIPPSQWDICPICDFAKLYCRGH